MVFLVPFSFIVYCDVFILHSPYLLCQYLLATYLKTIPPTEADGIAKERNPHILCVKGDQTKQEVYVSCF